MPIGRLGGSGGGGGRGGSASVGVLLRQTGENDKGLFLTASGADLTWHGRGESVGDTDPAIGSHVDLPNNGGGPGVNRHAYLRLRFPADITGYSGADSNNIVVRLNRLDAVAASPVVVWNAGTLTITVGASTSFSTLATAIAAFTTFTITTSQSDNAVGTDIFRLGADASGTNYNATGGRDEIEPGIELLAQPEDAVNGPNILAKYDPDNHTLQQILDELEDNDQGVTVTVPYGTDLTAAPEAVPWIRGFDAGIGPTEAPTTGTGGLTEDQVDGRVRILTKGYALRGGPIVPDSEIPDQEARDAEVPALLSSALTTRAPDSANYNDELPFLNSSGDWSKATSQVWRTFFKPNLQEWGNSPSGFVYRVGDIVPHNGGTYYCQTQHTKNTQTGPDGDDRWLPLRAFWGAWTARFYPTGTWVLHSSDLWLATEDVSNTETPGVSNKWHRVTNQAGLVLGGDWSSTATYRARRLIRHTNPANAWYLTTQDVPSGNEPGVASNWTDYYDRISWVDGAPDDVTGFSITGATFRANKRDGSHEQHTLPSGGTEVVGNPVGTGGDVLTRMTIGTRDYQIPQPNSDLFFLWWEETTIITTNQVSGRQWSLGNGATGGTFRMPFDCEVVALSLTYGLEPLTTVDEVVASISEVTVGFETVDFDAAVNFDEAQLADRVFASTPIADLEVSLPEAEDKWAYQDVFVPESGSPITISAGTNFRPVTTAFTERSPANSHTPGTELFATLILTLRRTGSDVPAMPVARPHISRFDLAAGNQNPVAGDIGGSTYAFTYAIAQASHAGSARIIGFEGDVQPTDSVEVLATLTDLDHGGGTVTIPVNTTLAADETYRIRLQVFGEGVTDPTAGTAPTSYQDIVITAHAAATANYHWGRVARVENQDAATYAAAIVFSTDDLVTGTTLDTTDGYDAAPDTTGNWIFYLAAKDDQTQPTGWTSGGFPANAVFQDSVDQDFSSVTFKVYIMNDAFYRTADDGTVNYRPVTS